ncbi:MAG TPA: hypothetical protein VGQ69_00555 [Gemmatimonadales bacterium]|jgi:hypothetical protein|nr:hypothetical protein [Gemmatimonadales bacterium]
MRLLKPITFALWSLAAGSCLGQSGTDPTDLGPGRRVLFIGNSYLYTQDVAGIVQALADSAGGDRLAVATVAGADLALIDHWNIGTARSVIAQGSWEWVVLQQGPSSVELNRDTLRLATQLFAAEIGNIGATPALFSAWPAENRRQDFPRAIESYTLAAADVSGILLPIASAWLAAWDRDPDIQLYQDGLHPSVEGAYLGALVIYARLLGQSPSGLPATLRLRSGRTISVAPQTAALLQAAAAEVTQAAVSR